MKVTQGHFPGSGRREPDEEVQEQSDSITSGRKEMARQEGQARRAGRKRGRPGRGGKRLRDVTPAPRPHPHSFR